MSFSVGQVRFVRDLNDGYPYPCKITKYDEEQGSIVIHWVGYGKNKDETLPIESKRILDVAGKSVGEICAQLVGMSTPGNDQNSKNLNKRSRDDVSSDDESPIPPNSKRRPSTLPDEGTFSQSVSQTDGVVPALSSAGTGLERSHTSVNDASAVASGLAAAVSSIGSPTGAATSTTPVVVPQLGDTEGGEASGSGSSVQQSCNFCSQEILSDFISCNKCRRAYHAETICVGISLQAIQVVLESTDGSITYVCSMCRAGRSVPANEQGLEVEDALSQNLGSQTQETQPALLQLVTQVQGIAASLKGVIEQVNRMQVLRQNPAVNNTPNRNEGHPATAPQSQRMHPRAPVAEEMLRSVREVNEREKRKHSVVLRGFGVSTVDEVVTKFREITEFLDVGSITLTDVVRINDNLFRGTINSVEGRLKLLAESRKLKGTRYDRMYIQRDLTYMQRQQVIANRRSDEGQAQAHPILTGANATRARTFFPSNGSSNNQAASGVAVGRGRGRGVNSSVSDRGGAVGRGSSLSRGGQVQLSSSNSSMRHIRREDDFLRR